MQEWDYENESSPIALHPAAVVEWSNQLINHKKAEKKAEGCSPKITCLDKVQDVENQKVK